MVDFPYDPHSQFEMNMPVASREDVSSDTDNARIAEAKMNVTPAEQARMIENSDRIQRTSVEFPPHLYIPEGAESLDLRAVFNVPSGTVDFEILKFVAPVGCVTRFIGYGIYNDGDAALNYNFKPLLNGNRIFRYHGEPLGNSYYRIALGLGPDLSNSSIIGCQLTLEPNMELKWLITNLSGVDTSMGVRMVGYFDTQQKRVVPKFG